MRTSIQMSLMAIILIFSWAPVLNAFSTPETNIHGFISQGYLMTDRNNLFCRSEDGSFEFNEMGINFSATLSPKLNCGMQFFARDLGDIGNDEIKLDWAFGDYRIGEYLGIRVGKMKMPIGLYHETRDADMLRTSILLPQSVYNEAWRDSNATVKGGELYGTLFLGGFGDITYNFQAGPAENAPGDGNAKFIADRLNVNVLHFDINPNVAYSMTWDTPLHGLKFRHSGILVDYDVSTTTAGGGMLTSLPVGTPLTIGFDSKSQFYSLEYTVNNLVISGEATWNDIDVKIHFDNLPGAPPVKYSVTWLGYYGSLAYRFTDWLEIGLYHAEYFPDKDDRDGKKAKQGNPNTPITNSWQKDTALSFRFDLNLHWTVKMEGHAMKGTALLYPSDQEDPTKVAKNWFLGAVKVTYSF